MAAVLLIGIVKAVQEPLAKGIMVAEVLTSIKPLGAKMVAMLIGRQAVVVVRAPHQAIPQSLVIHGVNKPL